MGLGPPSELIARETRALQTRQCDVVVRTSRPQDADPGHEELNVFQQGRINAIARETWALQTRQCDVVVRASRPQDALIARKPSASGLRARRPHHKAETLPNKGKLEACRYNRQRLFSSIQAGKNP